MNEQLTRLGNDLERATAQDLAARRRTRRSRRFLLAAAALAVAIPGLAFATSALISSDEVAASLPAGTRMLEGTEPRCTVIEQDVEYRCELTKPIANPEVSDLEGTVEPTVDATKHVNGGCRALDSEGRTWQCYIGQAAVDEKIIGAGFLGEYAPVPGVG